MMNRQQIIECHLQLIERNRAFNANADTSEDIHIACVVRGVDKYTILYRNDTKNDALRVLGRWASDPALTFTWYDAAMLSKVIREAT